MFEYFKRGWGHLFEGLTKPSMTALSIAFSIPTLCVLSAIIVGPRFLTGDSFKYFMVDSFDRHTLVSHRVLRGIPSDRPAVTILGTSIMDFCVNEALDLDGLFNAKSDKEYRVLNLATSSQTPLEMAAILAELDLPTDSVVIVGLNVQTFFNAIVGEEASEVNETLINPRFAFHSEVLEEEAELLGLHMPFRPGIYALENSKFFLARKKEILVNLLRGGRESANPLTAYWVEIMDNDEFRAGEMAKIETNAEEYRKWNKQNFAALHRMIDREHARSGASFILLQAPIHPGWYRVPAGEALFETFKQDVRDLADASGATYFSIQDHVHFQEDEFLDFEGHMKTDEARLKCSQAMAISLSEFQRGS